MIKVILLILASFLLACTLKPKTPPAHVSFINNRHSLEFFGLDPAISGELSRDTSTNLWETLLPVYRMPADTDLKDFQPIQHGRYSVKGSAVVFTPDTPFIAGSAYFMRYYHFGDINDVWGFIKQNKRLGSAAYNDLIFKR